MLEEIRKFYEQTKFDLEKEEFREDFKTPLNWVKIFFKTYPRFSKIKFSKKAGGLFKSLLNRESTREFSAQPANLADIEKILYFSAGIKEQKEELEKTRRFYPSAGARYPIEMYLIANNINSLPRGLYHYSVKNNELEELLNQDLGQESSSIFGKEMNKYNPNFLVLAGVMSRTEVKYGVNAYRFALLECGHIGQNMYLLSEKLGLGCCAIGGFDNDKLVRLLDLGEDEIPLYALAFGSKKQNP